MVSGSSHLKDGLSLLGLDIAVAGTFKTFDDFLTQTLGTFGSGLAFVLGIIAMVGLFIFALYELLMSFKKQ